MENPFLERLKKGPILCDGAMGTMLYQKGVSFERQALAWDILFEAKGSQSGDVIGRLRRAEPHLRSKIPTLWNDLLIALSARQIGATLVTGNMRDFDLLRRYLRFELEALTA